MPTGRDVEEAPAADAGAARCAGSGAEVAALSATPATPCFTSTQIQKLTQKLQRCCTGTKVQILTQNLQRSTLRSIRLASRRKALSY